MRPFIDIHIPKTGGQSRRFILWPRYCKIWQPKHKLCDKDIKPEDSIYLGHYKPIESLALLGPEYYKNKLVTCFFRDPRSRLVSLYYHLKKYIKWSFSTFVYKVLNDPIEPRIAINPAAMGIKGIKFV